MSNEEVKLFSEEEMNKLKEEADKYEQHSISHLIQEENTDR